MTGRVVVNNGEARQATARSGVGMGAGAGARLQVLWDDVSSGAALSSRGPLEVCWPSNERSNGATGLTLSHFF